MPKYPAHILELAKRGADVQFRELLNELNVLTLSFPHLRDAVDRDDLPVKFILRRGRDKANRTEPAAKRRTMSAKARKAIGDAQRKRWAVQKAAGKKT
jgi:transcriptional regulator of aromatic amino acid metabolism